MYSTCGVKANHNIIKWKLFPKTIELVFKGFCGVREIKMDRGFVVFVQQT
jgi:hypothetical protein